jgi:FAD:protein FMN transferase
MGSPCDLQLYAKSYLHGKHIAQQAIADIQRLEARYSRYRSDSFLSIINQIAAVGGSIEVDTETASLLNYAATCYQESDGLFDITAGILRHAWSFQGNQLPDPALIEQLLAKIGWHKVLWQPPILKFLIPGMELDLGGIVKEYAADRAGKLCTDAGIQHGAVNLGGDIKIIGAHPDGKPWRIGIRHPRRANEVIETLSLYQGALTSSGDYERCLMINGIRYSHILNPKTGWPVQYSASVSVIADFCVVAGSASTIAMLKEEQGGAWLDQLGLPSFWVNVLGHVGGSLTKNHSRFY